MNYIKLTLCLFSLTAIISCTDDSIDDTDNIIEEKQPNLKLKVDKNENNILEMVIFTPSYDPKYPQGYYPEIFDSIVFKTSEGNNTEKIADYTGPGLTSTTLWGHHFYTTGEKVATLIGYKNNKIIIEDKLTINITNSKDFLNTNWNQFEISEQNSGYINHATSNTLALYNTIKNDTPNILLSNSWDDLDNNNSDYEIISAEKNFKYLSNYITELYGEPKYTIENDPNIKSIFSKRFKSAISDKNPIKIWITNKNKIALIKKNMDYYILAEENK
ncbi:hypothetical protein [Empedobacter brevis]|uniref:hypothetical protein n=1 Tax=Empedobacter brevis TaxID=247 RepID=UPI0039B07E46